MFVVDSLIAECFAAFFITVCFVGVLLFVAEMGSVWSIIVGILFYIIVNGTLIAPLLDLGSDNYISESELSRETYEVLGVTPTEITYMDGDTVRTLDIDGVVLKEGDSTSLDITKISRLYNYYGVANINHVSTIYTLKVDENVLDDLKSSGV